MQIQLTWFTRYFEGLPGGHRNSIEGHKPLTEHIEAYGAHCRHAGHAARHIDQKAAHLTRLLESGNITRLWDLTADALERHLGRMKAHGLSARSVNFARQIAVAFYSWCVRTVRAANNPLRTVPKQDESRDRHRRRFALINRRCKPPAIPPTIRARIPAIRCDWTR